MIEKHYKTRELASLLGIHPETIRRAAAAGKLESIRVGLDRIYPESAIEAWLDLNRERAQHLSPDGRQTHASTGIARRAR